MKLWDTCVMMVVDKRLPTLDEQLAKLEDAGVTVDRLFIMGSGENKKLVYDHIDKHGKQELDYLEGYKKMAKEMLALNHERTLVLEDDAEPNEWCQTLLDKVREYLKENPIEFDACFLSGNRIYSQYQKVTEFLYRVSTMIELPAVIWSRKLLQVISEMELAANQPQIDATLYERILPNYKVYSVYPNAIDQVGRSVAKPNEVREKNKWSHFPGRKEGTFE